MGRLVSKNTKHDHTWNEQKAVRKACERRRTLRECGLPTVIGGTDLSRYPDEVIQDVTPNPIGNPEELERNYYDLQNLIFEIKRGKITTAEAREVRACIRTMIDLHQLSFATILGFLEAEIKKLKADKK